MHFSIGLDLKGFVLIKLQVYVWFLKPNLQKFSEIWFVTKMISLSWNYKVTGKWKEEIMYMYIVMKILELHTVFIVSRKFGKCYTTYQVIYASCFVREL